MLAQTIVETRPFVGNCSGRKIVKKKAEQIEDCSWFQNDGVFSGREFDGVCGAMCFVTGPLGQFVRIKVSNITALAQLAAGGSCMVMENSACVSRYAANRPRELPNAICCCPLAKIPAAVWPRFTAKSQARFTARARSSGVRVAVRVAKRLTERYRCLPGIGSKRGFFGWLCARDSDAAIAPRSESSSMRFVVARAVRPSITVRTETVSPCSATF
jgi:hypothetical protein